MYKNSQLATKRYLLDKFFFALFQLGGPFVSIRIASRFFDNCYWRKKQLVVVPLSYYQRGFYNLFAYISELSSNRLNLVFFNYNAIDQNMFYSNNFYKYWTNFLISGMEARFANFLNWKNVFERDKSRCRNRRRFENNLWWIHYVHHNAGFHSNFEMGGMVLHKYFFRAMRGVPKIILSTDQVRRDFFLPVPIIAEKLALFTFMYMLIRIYCFYAMQYYASRVFWDTRFLVYRKSQSLAMSSDVFSFTFTLYGQKYRQMQLWEYASYVESFLALPPLVKALAVEDIKYDPKE